MRDVLVRFTRVRARACYGTQHTHAHTPITSTEHHTPIAFIDRFHHCQRTLIAIFDLVDMPINFNALKRESVKTSRQVEPSRAFTCLGNSRIQWHTCTPKTLARNTHHIIMRSHARNVTLARVPCTCMPDAYIGASTNRGVSHRRSA